MFSKSSPQIAVRVLHMNLSCIYHLGNMTMVKTVFHIGEQLTIWNDLKAKIKNSKSCNSFKHLVKSCFFENLKNKEDNARIA